MSDPSRAVIRLDLLEQVADSLKAIDAHAAARERELDTLALRRMEAWAQDQSLWLQHIQTLERQAQALEEAHSKAEDLVRREEEELLAMANRLQACLEAVDRLLAQETTRPRS